MSTPPSSEIDTLRAELVAQAEVLRLERESFTEFRDAALKFIGLTERVHQSYGSTAGCGGGIGGQAITAHCTVLCQSPRHEPDLMALGEARHRLSLIIRELHKPRAVADQVD